MIIAPEHLLAQINTAMTNNSHMPVSRRVKEAIIIRDRFMSCESEKDQMLFNIHFYNFLIGKFDSWNGNHELDSNILNCYDMLLDCCAKTRCFSVMEAVENSMSDFIVEAQTLTLKDIESKIPHMADSYKAAELHQCRYNLLETYLYYMYAAQRENISFDRAKAVKYLCEFLRMHREGYVGSEKLFRKIAELGQSIIPLPEQIRYGIHNAP